METKQNLFIKVQLEKAQTSGQLTINIYFDKNAPNFHYKNDTISWYPTMDELSFINETFTLLNKPTLRPPTPPATTTNTTTTTTPLTTYTTPTPPPNYTTPPSTYTASPKEEPPEIVTLEDTPIITPSIKADAPLDAHIEDKPTKTPFENDASPEEILASIPTADSTDTTPPAEEKLIQADDKSITKALLDKLKKDHF